MWARRILDAGDGGNPSAGKGEILRAQISRNRARLRELLACEVEKGRWPKTIVEAGDGGNPNAGKWRKGEILGAQISKKQGKIEGAACL